MKEKETTLLGKLGYGLKYTLAIAIAILAICALCFIFINITTYFAPPLQPIFDQERLGQLGDFLGGTLNPIFGFATVCLLLWSVFIQRKELSLTRKELKKSRRALSGQLRQSRDESARLQLTELLLNELKTHEKLFEGPFGENEDDKKSGFYNVYGHKSLAELAEYAEDDIMSEQLHEAYINHDPTKKIETPQDQFMSVIWVKIFNLSHTLERIIGTSEDLLKVCHVEQIEKYWLTRVLEVVSKSRQAGIIDVTTDLNYQSRIQQSRISLKAKE